MNTIDHAAWCLDNATLAPTPRRVFEVPDYEDRVREKAVVPAYRVYPPLDVAAVRAHYASGLTLKQVGDLMGCSRERIRHVLSDLGVERKKGRRTVGAQA